MQEGKECKKCGENKSLDDYYDKPRLRSGKDATCKTCRKIMQRGPALAYYNRNKEEMNRKRCEYYRLHKNN